MRTQLYFSSKWLEASVVLSDFVPARRKHPSGPGLILQRARVYNVLLGLFCGIEVCAHLVLSPRAPMDVLEGVEKYLK